jgi:hypothetical protein
MGFELRTSHLLVRHSTSWAIQPAPSQDFIYYIQRLSLWVWHHEGSLEAHFSSPTYCCDFEYSAPKAHQVYVVWLHFKSNLKQWQLITGICFLVRCFWDMEVLFLYPTSDCGIQSQVSKRKIIFKTSLIFISKLSPMQGLMLISCTVEQDKYLPQPETLLIHPRQAKWLAFLIYQDYYLSHFKCVTVSLYSHA